MNPKYIFISKALYIPEIKTLAIGDLHLGYEFLINNADIQIPYSEFENMKDELKKIIEDIKKRKRDIKTVVFLGDIKHFFAYKKIERDLKLFHDDYKETKAMSAKSIQRIGVVRFNPFKDTGGNQSFVICLLDSKNDGFIISSLFTRDGSRFYTKPIEKGASNYALSAEEKEAIKKATSS